MQKKVFVIEVTGQQGWKNRLKWFSHFYSGGVIYFLTLAKIEPCENNLANHSERPPSLSPLPFHPFSKSLTLSLSSLRPLSLELRDKIVWKWVEHARLEEKSNPNMGKSFNLAKVRKKWKKAADVDDDDSDDDNNNINNDDDGNINNFGFKWRVYQPKKFRSFTFYRT